MQKIIQKAKRILMIRHNLKSIDNLDYIGSTDCSFIQKGSEMLQFNINQPGHKFHRSTKSYNYKPLTLKEKVMTVVIFILVTGIVGCAVGSYLQDYKIGGWF